MGIQKFFYQITTKPKDMFLLDAAGALLTAILLSLVIAPLESTFGMPKNVLYILSGLAFALFSYSISCYLLNKQNYKSLLLILIISNSMYIILSAGMIILYSTQLTLLGLFYFITEILVIAAVILFEFKIFKFLSKDLK
ncbi:MAG: hypothetical protein ACSHWW_09245 [Nonlabens sp.]|uniref:hypothetical protein n=1 Tax=Nonlabens sp. TaxID=1888209 RepID=UPI003EF45C23